ncbi:MAG: cell division protein ZapE [Pseudohongiellaceae bacterium]
MSSILPSRAQEMVTHTVSPKQRYADDVANGLITFDTEQHKIVSELDALYERLTSKQTKVGGLKALLGGLLDWNSDSDSIDGLYIWGGVGRGKTYLMDLFFDCLPIEQKQRAHFHRFMQFVHGQLTQLQGQKNPLEQLADRISAQAKVFCFDEFFVLDIGDAMILAGLLDALFARGVVLVATSNIHPDGLYENGLQRQRFVPAIELIKQHTRVLELASDSDYRLRSLQKANLYITPITTNSDEELAKKFAELTHLISVEECETSLTILDRPIKARRIIGDVAWFDFEDLCGGPRSAFDYIEIAKIFHTLIISNVPSMSDDDNDRARRFVSLIDELYDRKVKLVLSAAAPILSIYQGGSLAFPFERTCSRLLEMQSHDYLACAHQA